MDDIMATLKEVVCEDVAEKMEALDLRHASDGEGATQSNLDRKVEIYGKAYRELAEFVKKEEAKIAKMAIGDKPSGIAARITRCIPFRSCQGHPARQPTGGGTVPTYDSSYERDMVIASRVESSTGEVEVAWVRRENEMAWEAAVGSMVFGAAP